MIHFSKKKIIIASIILLVVFVWFFHHINKKEILPPMVAVTKGSIVENAEAVGYIITKNPSTVKSQTSGIVDELYHEEGEYVTKGTPLAKLKSAPEPAEYATVYQTLADATSQEKSAELDLERFNQALKAKIISAYFTDYINAKKTYESAKIQKLLAKQKLALLDKGETKIGNKATSNVVTSPIDGYILTRNVSLGDSVISLSSAQAATSLFTIANMNDLIFQGLVDEMDVTKLKLNMDASIKIGSLSDANITGSVSKIALQADQQDTSGASTVFKGSNNSSPFNVGFKVEIANLKFPKNIILRSGYSATAKIKTKSVDNVLLLPMRVIKYENEKPYVLLFTRAKDEPKHQPVDLGLTDGVNVEIKSGLKLGDKIVDKPEVAASND